MLAYAGTRCLAAPPEFVERLLGRLADEVPEGDLETRYRARTGSHVVPQRSGELFDVEGILAQQLGFAGGDGRGIHARPDSCQPLVRMDFRDGPTADPVGAAGTRIPGRFHSAGFPDGLQRDHPYVRDLQPRRRLDGRQHGSVPRRKHNGDQARGPTGRIG
jgi:hypothetical protein